MNEDQNDPYGLFNQKDDDQELKDLEAELASKDPVSIVFGYIKTFIKNLFYLFKNDLSVTNIPGPPGVQGDTGMMGWPADYFYKEWLKLNPGKRPDDFVIWFDKLVKNQEVISGTISYTFDRDTNGRG